MVLEPVIRAHFSNAADMSGVRNAKAFKFSHPSEEDFVSAPLPLEVVRVLPG